MPHERKCQGIRSDGKRCGAPPKLVNAKGYCFNHDPERREEHLAASRRGGKATAKKFERPGIEPEELGELEDVKDVRRWLCIVGQAVASGRIDHRAATAALKAAEIAGKMVQAVTREELAELREELAKARRGLKRVS